MNKIFKVIAILLLPFMIELITSCCDCPETTYLNYTNCSLAVNNLDNSGEEPVISQSAMIPKEAFGIRVSVGRSENVCKAETKSVSLFRSAYAFDCKCPPEQEYLPKDSIVSVKIHTTFIFDSTHAAGTDVSEYFFVYQYGEFMGIEEYIGKIQNRSYALEYLKHEFDLLLMTPPGVEGQHQFTVSVELSDKRVLIAQTKIISLNG